MPDRGAPPPRNRWSSKREAQRHQMTSRAVVFAYHNVGVRCLKTLLAHGIEVPLVVTHQDDPAETRWFGSVADTAADYGLATIAWHHGVDFAPDYLYDKLSAMH